MSGSYEDIFARLIGFDTTSYYSNLELIEWVRSYLSDYGVESHLVYNEDETKANLFATIGGDGDISVARGIALSGHTDVVPIAGQDWSSPAFELHRRGDKFYGRGTCDMKGFIAVVLSCVPAMVAESLRTPLHIALSYDEEVGCYGAPRMIAEFGKRFVCPQVVIVGEPSNMQVVSAHKGMNHMHTRVVGLPRHSSQIHLGVNANFYGARLIEHLRLLGESLSRDGLRDEHFDPPYSSVSVGIVRGGTAENIVAEHCEIAWELRNLPGDDADALLERYYVFERELDAEMRSRDSSCGIETERYYTPAFAEDLQSSAELLVRSLTGDNEVRYVSYCTESGQFQGGGSSVVICGPGSIDQAHRPDEYVSIAQMDSCEDFMVRLIDYCRKHRL